MELKIKEIDGHLLVIGELDDGSFYVVENVDPEMSIEGLGEGYLEVEIKFMFKQGK